MFSGPKAEGMWGPDEWSDLYLVAYRVVVIPLECYLLFFSLL